MKTESLSYGELLDLQTELRGAPSLHQQLALEAVNAAVELREQHQDRENLFQELDDERSRAEEAEEKRDEYDEDATATSRELESANRRIEKLEAQLAAKPDNETLAASFSSVNQEAK